MTGGMNIAGLSAAFDDILTGADLAGSRVVTRSQAVFLAAVQASFTGSHPKGAPTTAAPGKPPDVVSGTLRRSLVSERAAALGPGMWQGRTYPTTVYSRIHELGGTAGRGGHTRIPARPYMAPSLDGQQDKFASIHAEEYAALISEV